MQVQFVLSGWLCHYKSYLPETWDAHEQSALRGRDLLVGRTPTRRGASLRRLSGHSVECLHWQLMPQCCEMRAHSSKSSSRHHCRKDRIKKTNLQMFLILCHEFLIIWPNILKAYHPGGSWNGVLQTKRKDLMISLTQHYTTRLVDLQKKKLKPD